MRTVPIGALGAIPGRRSSSRPRATVVAALCGMALLLAGWIPALAGSWPPNGAKIGNASWYGHEFARRRTASGERFNPHDFTGAHRTLPLGAKVRVTNLRNGRSVLVTINDRGPFRTRREIDLSLGAAKALGMVETGVARVMIELVSS
jgi:rare lipoprotein A